MTTVTELLAVAQAENDQAWGELQAAFPKCLNQEITWDEYSALAHKVTDTAVKVLEVGNEGDLVYTFDGPLVIAAILVNQIILTEDGNIAIIQWHTEADGPYGESIRYERWVDYRREGHGYIHPISRKIVQTG